MTKFSNPQNFEIDLVYLWCDDADPVWHAKRQKYRPLKADVQAVCDGRFVQNDELKYSLRSVAKFMPWVRNIHIVTDHQTPAWLNTNHPKIKMVNHEDIIDEKYLPLFNSSAIEVGLANIPNLSECFAFMNDDCLIGRPLKLDDLFHKGLPICRMICQGNISNPPQYERKLLKMQEVVKQKGGKLIPFFPHHNLDVYRKSNYNNCIEKYADVVLPTLEHRFRKEGDWSRALVYYDMISNGQGIMKVVNLYKESVLHWLKYNLLDFGHKDSIILPVKNRNIAKRFKKAKPMFFCVEDGELCTPEDRIRGREFLQKLFPEKSEFEK